MPAGRANKGRIRVTTERLRRSLAGKLSLFCSVLELELTIDYLCG